MPKTNTTYVLYFVFDGTFEILKKLALENIHKWALCCTPSDEATCNSHFELWLGPNMLRKHNLDKLKKFIKVNNLMWKLEWKSVYDNCVVELKETLESQKRLLETAKNLEKTYKKMEFEVLGYYCNSKAYSNFVKFVLQAYYNFVASQITRSSEYVVNAFYVDAYSYVPGKTKETTVGEIINDSQNYQRQLTTFFLEETKSDMKIHHDGSKFLDDLFYLKNITLSYFLLTKSIDFFTPSLFKNILLTQRSCEAERKKDLKGLLSLSLLGISPSKLIKTSKNNSTFNLDFYVKFFLDKYNYFSMLGYKFNVKPSDFFHQQRISKETILKNSHEKPNDFLNDLVKSTIILLNSNKILPLSYYFAFISLYVVDMVTERKKNWVSASNLIYLYIQKLLKEIPQYLPGKIELLNVKLIDHIETQLQTSIPKANSEGDKRYFKKIIYCLDIIRPETAALEKIIKNNFYRSISEIKTILKDFSSIKELPAQINRILAAKLMPSELGRLAGSIEEKLVQYYPTLKSNPNPHDFFNYVKTWEKISPFHVTQIIKKCNTRYIVYCAFDGNFEAFEKIAMTNLHKWALSCPDTITLELWLGPNMLQPSNLNPLMRYIENKGLKKKWVIKRIPKLIEDIEWHLKRINNPELARQFRKICEMVKLDVLGYYCNYGAYTDFVRYVALYYYLFVETGHINKSLYIDAPDTYVPGSTEKTTLHEFESKKPTFQDNLIKLFRSENKSGIQIGIGARSFFANNFFYITNKQFTRLLFKEIVKNYTPFLFNRIKWAAKKGSKQEQDNELFDIFSNYYCGCFLWPGYHTNRKRRHDENIFAFTIMNSGPDFIENFTKQFADNNSEFKGRYGEKANHNFMFKNREYNKCIGWASSWISDKSIKQKYEILPISKYIKNSDHFIDYQVESTIILAKHAKVLPLSYYLALIPLYKADQEPLNPKITLKVCIKKYLEKLKIKFPNNLNNIQLLNIDWLDHSKDRFKKEVANSKQENDRKVFFEKMLKHLENISEISNNIEKAIKEGNRSTTEKKRLYGSHEIKKILEICLRTLKW